MNVKKSIVAIALTIPLILMLGTAIGGGQLLGQATIGDNVNASVANDTGTARINPENGLPYSDHLVNGDFEYFDGLTSTTGANKATATMVSLKNNTFYDWFSYKRLALPEIFDKQRFGWMSMQDIQRDNGTASPGDVEIDTDYYTHNKCSQLFAEQSGTAIYQDIATNPGDTYQWELKHANCLGAKGTVEKMKVLIGAVAEDGTVGILEPQKAKHKGASDAEASYEIATARKVDSRGGYDFDGEWETYVGEYTVPAEQTITRFTFQNVSGANQLDDIVFAVKCTVTYVDKLTGNTVGTESVPAYTKAQGVNNVETRHGDEGYSFKGYQDDGGNDVDMSNITKSMTVYLNYEKDLLPIEVESSSNNEYQYGSALVSWPQYNYTNKNFKVYQSADNGVTWNSVGIDYRSVKEVRCLQIYPIDNAKNQLQDWIVSSGFGQGIIRVTPASIEQFNSDPWGYLKGADGNWNYDVLFFGTWDSNNLKDLTATSSDAVEKYINAGKGVIFGHDVISSMRVTTPDRLTRNQYFNRLAPYFNISIPNDCPATFNVGRSTQAIITRNGLMNNYPNNIGGVGTVLNIPSTHSSQYAKGNIWSTLNDYTITEGEPERANNFYLATWNNTAMVQTGHSNGESTADEQRMLANLIFYMNQLTFSQSSLRDASAQDTTVPTVSELSLSEGKTVSIPLSDAGNTYSYRVESYSKDDTTESGLIQTSDVKDVTVTTGTRKLYYLFDTSPDTKLTASTSGMTAMDVTDGDTSVSYVGHYGQYMHVMSQDGAGNVSETKTIAIPQICTLTYVDAKTGKTVKTLELECGNDAEEVDDAVKSAHRDEGYSFAGYRDAAEGGNELSLDNITASATIYLTYTLDPLPIEVTSDTDGFGSATVSWTDYDYRNKNFKVYQSPDDGKTWNSVGIDYRSVNTVRCLQIYPIAAAEHQLEEWVVNSGFGQGIIKITPVSQDVFNTSYASYLKDANGQWKYDVIYIGTWDANNFKDLTESARDALEEYIKSGRGLIFGHDTFSYWAHWGAGTPYKQHDVYNSLLHYCNAKLITPITIDASIYEKTKVRIIRNGLLVNYPNYIGKVGDELNVPPTHVGPMMMNDPTEIWVEFSDANLGMSPLQNVSNSYISVHNNTAILATGHSNGTATSDEQKILANLIFYMNQLLFDTAELKDASAQDITAPSISSHSITPGNGAKVTLSSEDAGTTYRYKVESYSKDDTTETGKITTSNEEPVTVTTGTKNYYYLFDDSPETEIDDIKSVNLTKTENVTDDIDYTGHEGKYMHAVVVDGAGNVSDTYTLQTPAPMPPSFDVVKVMTDGTSIGDGEFSFSLYSTSPVGYDPTGDALVTASCDSEGHATLVADGENAIKTPGTYKYAIKENASDRSGIRFDSHVEGVMVTASDNGDGTLKLEYAYDMHQNDTTKGKGILFENVRLEEPLYVEKIATGVTSTFSDREYEFTFKMADTNGIAMKDVMYHRYAKDGELGKLTEIASGTIDDGETFTMKSGEQYMFAGHGGAKYSISENVPAGYTVESYDETGTLETNARIPATASFYNAYSAAGSPDAFSGVVRNDMFPAQDGQYEFTLTDKDGNVIETVANGSGGVIDLTAPKFTQADDGKTYKYRLSQVIPEDQGSYIRDDEEMIIEVTVHDDGDGTLSFDVKYSKGKVYDSDMPIPFVNKFSVGLPMTGIASSSLPVVLFGFGVIVALLSAFSLRKRIQRRGDRSEE